MNDTTAYLLCFAVICLCIGNYYTHKRIGRLTDRADRAERDLSMLEREVIRLRDKR